MLEYMTGDDPPPPEILKNSAARPARYCEFYRLAFYNIGWDAKSKKSKISNPKPEI